MIILRGSIPFPPSANSAPIRSLATNLQQLARSLVESGQRINGTAQSAAGTWAGAAATAYVNHTSQRARTVASVGSALAKAVPVLQTFAAAIDSCIAAYNVGVKTEMAGYATSWGGGAALVASGKAMQTAAVGSLQAAGGACAGSLIAIEAEVAAAQFLGVDKATLDGLKGAAGSIWESVVDLVTTGDTDAAVTALDRTVDVIGLIGILGNSQRDQVGEAARPQLTDAQRQLVDYGTTIKQVKDAVKPVLLGVEGAAEGLHHGAHHFSSEVHRRNGTVYTRWTAAGRGSATGLTQQQAAQLSSRVLRWTRPVPVVSAAADGAVQYLTDQGNPGLTTTQRVSRTGTAVALQGGAGWAGAVAGAEGGAVIGAGVGAAFGGVGAVPGAVIGGVVGAVGGGIAGSAVGRWVKEQLFAWNPGGVYQ